MKSAATLKSAENKIKMGISDCLVENAFKDITRDLSIPHLAFVIYPGDNSRKLIRSQVKPVSDWAQDLIFKTLEFRGAEAAYKMYKYLNLVPAASAFRGQLWEHKVHQYFTTLNHSPFTIRCLEDNSTMKWAPFKNISTFNFGPANKIVGYLHECITSNKAGYFLPTSKTFASFDAIVYKPGEPLANIQITQNCKHPINLLGSKLFEGLLSPSDSELNPFALLP